VIRRLALIVVTALAVVPATAAACTQEEYLTPEELASGKYDNTPPDYAKDWGSAPHDHGTGAAPAGDASPAPQNEGAPAPAPESDATPAPAPAAKSDATPQTAPDQPPAGGSADEAPGTKTRDASPSSGGDRRASAPRSSPATPRTTAPETTVAASAPRAERPSQPRAATTAAALGAQPLPAATREPSPAPARSRREARERPDARTSPPARPVDVWRPAERSVAASAVTAVTRDGGWELVFVLLTGLGAAGVGGFAARLVRRPRPPIGPDRIELPHTPDELDAELHELVAEARARELLERPRAGADR